MAETKEPWLVPCVCACGCGRHHIHTIFKVKDGHPHWFVSTEHLAAYEALRTGEIRMRSAAMRDTLTQASACSGHAGWAGALRP